VQTVLEHGPALPGTVTQPNLNWLVLVLAASALAAILSRVHRRLVLPTVVVELALGIAIGPDVLDWARPDAYVQFLSKIGLAMLFFMAGLEVVEKKVPRRALRRGTAGWFVSLVLGMAVGYTLHALGLDASGWLLGIALTTTALGTLVPILSDAGLLSLPVGSAVLGTGVSGEFWPIVVISVFLTGTYGATTEILLLVGFGLVVVAGAATALRARPPRIVRVIQETVHTTGQAAVRLSILTLGALVLLAHDSGFDSVLGAFAAGIVVGLALEGPGGELVRARIEGIGFGFLIPIYFVVTGMTFDIDSLLTTKGLACAALFLGLLVVVRGASALLWRRELTRRETAGLALLGATGLPLIVAIVDIGTSRDAITPQLGASLVGAGMISVLVLPLAALAVIGKTGRPATAAVPLLTEELEGL
jgi:Kef-type K+ transport system membrane component KefB